MLVYIDGELHEITQTAIPGKQCGLVSTWQQNQTKGFVNVQIKSNTGQKLGIHTFLYTYTHAQFIEGATYLSTWQWVKNANFISICTLVGHSRKTQDSMRLWMHRTKSCMSTRGT